MSEYRQFCLIPEGGLNITTQGLITPCCVDSETKLGHIEQNSINETFNNEIYKAYRESHRQNLLPTTCKKNCVDRNNNFVHRQAKNDIIIDAEKSHRKHPNKEKLVLLEIGLGNVCNLTCTFCDESASSSWAKIKNLDSNIYYFNQETTLSIASELRDMRWISFKGGEPLNIPYFDKFLTIFYKNNPDCRVNLITNGTEYSDKIFSALFKFDTVITVSVEATGKLYQYLRGGKYVWQNVLDNIKSFKKYQQKNIELNISSLLLLYNYTTWVDDMLTIQNQIDEIFPGTTIGCQLCINPESQSIFLLSNEQRRILADKILHGVDKGLKLNNYEDMISSLIQDRPLKVSRTKVFDNLNFNNKMRNMNLFDIVENFSPYLVVE